MAGRICLWQYRDHARERPGFHLSADPAGCAQLLTLLADLRTARKPRIGTVVLDPVTTADTAIASDGREEWRINAYQRWELLIDPRFPPEHLRFVAPGDHLRTELSPIQTESLIAGVEDIRVRRGGYSIGDDEHHQLWFWWQAGA